MIARYYLQDRNPDGRYLPGVPLRDITQSEYDALPVYLQVSVDNAGFYRKTPTREPSKPAPHKE